MAQSGWVLFFAFLAPIIIVSYGIGCASTSRPGELDRPYPNVARFKTAPFVRTLRSQISDQWMLKSPEGRRQQSWRSNDTWMASGTPRSPPSSSSQAHTLIPVLDEAARSSEEEDARKISRVPRNTKKMLSILVTAIHVDKAEFPLSRLLFKLTLRMAIEAAEKQLEQSRVRLSVSVRSANTCSRQYAGAIAAEEYYTKKARLFIVSGCDDSIRAVSRLASIWKVPIMTAAGFGTDLNDKSTHKTLVRVAFSLRGAVDFLFKIMKSFQWHRVNLLVDESDPNSLALKGSIEQHSKVHNSIGDFQVQPNLISLDFQMLSTVSQTTSSSTNTSMSLRRSHNITVDTWPTDLMARAVRDALRKSSLYSRVNVLLVPQHYLRKFMLAAYDQGMANGLYTFINMPLLLIPTDDQFDSNSYATSNSNFSRQSYVTTTGDNVYLWRSLLSSRNTDARRAFESLMSIYLKAPVSKAYIYFANKLSTLANAEYGTTTTSTTTQSSVDHRTAVDNLVSSKMRLDTNPYSASFYDSIQIYATTLAESLRNISMETDSTTRRRLRQDLHAQIANKMRNRRFENMVTGTVSINANGDRNTDYSLDDMNQMTGKFNPVITYKAETRDIERLSRIHWSSDPSVGQTTDSVDCILIGTCVSKPIPRFLVALGTLVVPLGILVAVILYLIHKHLSMESKLVDYWWRIQLDDIEFIITRRKKANDGSLLASTADSLASSGAPSEQASGFGPTMHGSLARTSGGSRVAKTTSGRATNLGTTTIGTSSVVDVCYGDISLGLYKQAKVAVKPIAKYHQSRKLMLELRTLKSINHNNLCRFIGIIADESNPALVSEFCAKGSLREFFQNEAMVIDWTFKYSIINDITAGLLYLHSSKLGFHGRLKSSNCLISSRFVVKLSDYGPHSLFEKLDSETSADEEDQLKKQIWIAPELLRSNSLSGSPDGDIYSYGLLLYEVITNNPPFFDTTKNDYVMPLNSLVNELKTNGISATTGPDVSIIDAEENKIEPLVDLMKSCWSYEPRLRPASMVLRTAIKKITHGITSEKLLDNLSRRMEHYTNNLESLVDSKLATLVEEKLRTEELVYQFVPKSIASMLKEQQTIEPEAFECVTVFYSDIVGFTSLSSESTPMQVIDVLSDLYLCFDEILEKHDIYKVDTIGDAYIVASGLPERNEGKHAVEIACTALELRQRLSEFKIHHKPDRRLEMRVGIHSGPCVAGIVGNLEMPKYCVFGETITMGRFMESSGLPMKIHITEESKKLLQDVDGFIIEPRVPKIKREGLPVQTFWLERI